MEGRLRSRAGRRLALALFWAALVLAWAIICRCVPLDQVEIKDEPWHQSVLISLLRGDPGWREISHAENDYPPAYYALAFASGRLLGRFDRFALTLPNLLLLFVIGLATRRLAARLWGGMGGGGTGAWSWPACICSRRRVRWPPTSPTWPG